ncbi:hypothetical protein EC9_40150 [Rosistilla ulvae]|uniref:Uncharacterized protein n=1 Tax=Rosistilla ulvae TaxID=1930277 RepID=A0A517M4L6_9BACT|nr:hypothetical protein EC9_40150 [Rosistilla ulvae]
MLATRQKCLASIGGLDAADGSSEHCHLLAGTTDRKQFAIGCGDALLRSRRNKRSYRQPPWQPVKSKFPALQSEYPQRFPWRTSVGGQLIAGGETSAAAGTRTPLPESPTERTQNFVCWSSFPTRERTSLKSACRRGSNATGEGNGTGGIESKRWTRLARGLHGGRAIEEVDG